MSPPAARGCGWRAASDTRYNPGKGRYEIEGTTPAAVSLQAVYSPGPVVAYAV
jgi:hypothetical protein